MGTIRQKERWARIDGCHTQQWSCLWIATEVLIDSNVIQRATHALMTIRDAKTLHRLNVRLAGRKSRMKSIFGGKEPRHIDA
jgi:hypothetical protein